MPLYRSADKLIYFAHIPKCAGSSVSTYLATRFGPPAFEDRKYGRYPIRRPWNRSSPQHIPVRYLKRLLPDNMVDLRFAVVRHPEDRVRSTYFFQRDKAGRVPKWLPFSVWLRGITFWRLIRPFALDGHLNPQVAYVTDDTRIFRLEDGLDKLEAYLNAELGPAPEGLDMGHEKKGKAKTPLSAADARLVERIYADDYDRFGYPRRGDAPRATQE